MYEGRRCDTSCGSGVGWSENDLEREGGGGGRGGGGLNYIVFSKM